MMHRIRTWALTKAHVPPPLTTPSPSRTNSRATVRQTCSRLGIIQDVTGPQPDKTPDSQDIPQKRERNIVVRFLMETKGILLYSIINVLLLFVPVGMAVHFTGMPAGVVFAMNAIAIIPLAGLLSHATESVASRMGDTAGALINVTFGNAVELIIFIIALVKDQIRIVQASLVGSILANLLLILGMSFFLGGLRFREQIYNSTVTQMSACLLSLSVTSLLLPTAFHASFQDLDIANEKVLKVSRGTSIVLLLVYLLYLVFQLRSHSYMYESTPQDIIERESVPGPAAQYFHPNHSFTLASLDSDSDSDGSLPSETRRRRKAKGTRKKGKKSAKTSISSRQEPGPSSSHGGSRTATPDPHDDRPPRRITLVDTPVTMTPITTPGAVLTNDPMDKVGSSNRSQPNNDRGQTHTEPEAMLTEKTEPVTTPAQEISHSKRVDFAQSSNMEAQPPLVRPRPFSLRSLRPPINAFTASPINPVAVASAAAAAGGEPSREAGHIRRSRTMPASRRPNFPRRATSTTVPGTSVPTNTSHTAPTPGTSPNQSRTFQPNNRPNQGEDQSNESHQEEDDNEKQHQTSITTAILLLLTSTALVAVCAEFMVDSIDDIVSTDSSSTTGGGISEAFIGLILLPIVGNAAEHVTAVSVALKNKMDLAIGVALGSSIQISLFITPLVVLVGWAMGKDMSLFFTLFETICMFVSAFIVNFLVLDGRSNYLEGALLCSAYVIISVAAFFSPNPRVASQLGGGGSGDGGT